MALLCSLTTMISDPGGNDGLHRPPLAKKVPVAFEAHGVTRIDDYCWLNERDHSEVLDYLNAENRYTKGALKHTDALQQKLFEEMVGRIKQTDMSVPYRHNGYYYYTRYEEGAEYPVYCRKKGSLEGGEEVLADVNELAAGLSFYQVGSMAVSDDNNTLAWSADTVSRRIYSIFFKDLRTGALYDDVIPGTSGSIAWAADHLTIFYSVRDHTLRPYRIYRHCLGSTVENDVLVYEEQDPTFNLSVFRMKSRDYIAIVASSSLTDEWRLLRSDDPQGEFSVFQPRRRGVEYSVAHAGERFLIRTNLEAENFRLMQAYPGHTGAEEWEELIAHRDHVYLEDFEVFGTFIALCERCDARTDIRILTGRGNDFYMPFPEEVFSVGFENNPEFETDELRVSYTSLTTPLTVYDFNTTGRSFEMLKQQEVMGGFEPSRYEARRLFATASDNVRVPVSLVYRKELFRKGTNPLLLYGYGSYGISVDPIFSPVRLSLLDRGFVFAIAHVRGGQEMGRHWYEEGRMMKKKNTFTDFISCGEHLLQEGYAGEGRLFAMGGSAGGLLVGAVINMRPDLFHAAVAAVPFVDVVTTMLDDSIPLTTGEYDEWGNPNEKESFEYMLSYSPYDNVAAMDYPALLVTAGYHDSQVQYWEPAKWVAKLRVTSTGSEPLFLWTNMEYGHGGAAGRFQRYRETALEYAFLLDRAGMPE